MNSTPPNTFESYEDLNPWDILDIKPSASKEEIKRAYRRLAMKWHPDRNKDPDAEEMFKKISWAYIQVKDGNYVHGQRNVPGGGTAPGWDPFSGFDPYGFDGAYDPEEERKKERARKRREKPEDDDFSFYGEEVYFSEGLHDDDVREWEEEVQNQGGETSNTLDRDVTVFVVFSKFYDSVEISNANKMSTPYIISYKFFEKITGIRAKKSRVTVVFSDLFNKRDVKTWAREVKAEGGQVKKKITKDTSIFVYFDEVLDTPFIKKANRYIDFSHIVSGKSFGNIAESPQTSTFRIVFSESLKASLKRWKRYINDFGVIDTEINEDTTIYVYSDKNDDRAEIKKAKRYGAKVMSFEKFIDFMNDKLL